MVDDLAAVVFDDPQDHPGQRSLPAAALAHKPQDFPLVQVKADVPEHLLPVVVGKIRKVFLVEGIHMGNFEYLHDMVCSFK